MIEHTDIPQLILSGDSPEGVLELPDNRCQLHVKLVAPATDSSSAVRKSLDRSRSAVGASQQRDDVEVILHQLLIKRFSLEELRTLCFCLAVDYEALPGDGKTEMARELLIHLKHRKRLADLVRQIKQARPDVHEDLPPEVITMVQKPVPASDRLFAQQDARQYRPKIG